MKKKKKSMPYILHRSYTEYYSAGLSYYICFPQFLNYVLVEIRHYYNYSSEMDSSKSHRNDANLHALVQ